MTVFQDVESAETTAIAEAILAGRRRELARAITMIESTRPDHRKSAEALLDRLQPHSGQSFRLGISLIGGYPQVDKSQAFRLWGRHIIHIVFSLLLLLFIVFFS